MEVCLEQHSLSCGCRLWNQGQICPHSTPLASHDSPVDGESRQVGIQVGLLLSEIEAEPLSKGLDVAATQRPLRFGTPVEGRQPIVKVLPGLRIANGGEVYQSTETRRDARERITPKISEGISLK